MQVSKWGNSLAIRLPAAVVEALKLKEGDDNRNHPTAGALFRRHAAWSEDQGADNPQSLLLKFTGNAAREAGPLERKGSVCTAQKSRKNSSPRICPQFFYLALQESDCDTNSIGPVTSSGIAKGLWQFIPETGMKYGLRMGPWLTCPSQIPATATSGHCLPCTANKSPRKPTTTSSPSFQPPSSAKIPASSASTSTILYRTLTTNDPPTPSSVRYNGVPLQPQPPATGPIPPSPPQTASSMPPPHFPPGKFSASSRE